jgi:hypothetical protein
MHPETIYDDPSINFDAPYVDDTSTEARLDRIENKVNELDVKLTTILEAVDNIMGQAKPAIDQLVNSPLMKMITGGK